MCLFILYNWFISSFIVYMVILETYFTAAHCTFVCKIINVMCWQSFKLILQCNIICASLSGHMVEDVGLQLHAWWDCWFKSHWRWMFVCCECCVLSGRGLCDELITHPEESYRLWCIVVCDLKTSWMRRPWPTRGCCTKKKIICSHMWQRRGGEKFYFLLTSHLCCNAGVMLTHTQIMDYFYFTLSHTITELWSMEL
jgi:hypothetical protein